MLKYSRGYGKNVTQPKRKIMNNITPPQNDDEYSEAFDECLRNVEHCIMPCTRCGWPVFEGLRCTRCESELLDY